MKPFGDRTTKSMGVPDLEERFNPSLRNIGEAQLQEHDDSNEKPPASKLVRLEFSSSIPSETKILLTDQLASLLDFADEFGLRLRSTGHLFRFLDQNKYEQEIGSSLPNSVSLPASRLDFDAASRIYTIIVILPEKMDSGDVVVNTIRTFFSKLFGSIYFEEQIKPLEFYQQNSSSENQASAGIPEILDLIKSTGFKSKNLYAHCEGIAKAYRMSMKKQGDQIRQQLVDEWRQKWDAQSLTTEDRHTIESVFSEFEEVFRTDPDSLFQSSILQIRQLNAQMHFILPHEQNDYARFEQDRPAHFLRSIQNKFEEINALSGFIKELHSLLSDDSVDTEYAAMGSEILKRMRQLRKEKKVVLFYVPDMPLNNDLKRIKQRFPLRLVKLLPVGTPLEKWSKEVKKMEKHYANSIYAKLYTALHSMSLWTKAKLTDQDEVFKKSSDAERLQQMMHILNYRLPTLRENQSSLGILLDINEQWHIQENRQLIPLAEFHKAWGYFIAFILTLLYYQNPLEAAGLPKGFRSEYYLKSILRFIDQQCSKGINYFHIVKLLWLIYEEKSGENKAKETAKKNASSAESEGLDFVLYSLQNPQAILRYTLHQLNRPETETASLERRLQKLPQYRDAWIAAFQNRLDQAID